MIAAAVIAFAWCGVAIWLGPRIGYVDRPDDPSLKVHRRPAVPLGGVGIFVGIHTAALLRDGLEWPLLAGSSLVLALGLIDDRRGLPPLVRLTVEVAAAIVLVAGGGWDGQGAVSVALAVVLVVLAINAVNLLDGLDGLAGSAGLVSALGVAWLASGRGLESSGGLELAAALAGFLILNWHPARVFLGDSGAYVVGLVLAHRIVVASPGGAVELVVAASLFGVFALDVAATLLRRVVNRVPLFTGDRQHLYDVLRERGISVPIVALIAASTQALFVVTAVGVDRALVPWQGLLVMGGLVLVLLTGLALSGFLREGARQS